jgi:hypothetical protein
MIDLGLNQYKVKEIRYEVKEGKTVIFKLHNFNLEDVEIEETPINEEKTETAEEFEKRKTREMIDTSKNLFNFTKEKREQKQEFKEELRDFLSQDYDINKRETISQRAKRLIDDVIEEDSKILKERLKDRGQEIYHTSEPNDSASKIKKVSDIYDSKLEPVTENDKKYDSEKVSDEAFWEKEFEKLKKVGTMKVDRKTDEIVSFEPTEEKEEKKE